MPNFISLESANEAMWQILNDLGYSQKHNDDLCEEVYAVLDEYVQQDNSRVNKIIEEVKGWD